jgi:putative DNA primase/helicase
MNELDHCVYYRGKRLQDVDYTNIRCTISDKLDLVFSEPDIIRATEQVASQNAFHPVRNYLNSLTWDQKDYIPDLAECLEVAYQDSDHQALVQRMLLKFLVSCVARAFEPGCKVDTILVLKGDQGCRKSTFLRKLAVMDDWFSDQQIDIDHKDSQETIQGKWIMEFGEFYSLKKKEADSIKAFLSRQVDDFRKAYGRGNQQYPRQVVFTGSTNNDEFLTDNVNRRFWVVSVGKIDTDRFEKVRAQLWAQAVAAYKQGETHYLNEQDQELMNQYVNDYRNQDVWTDQVIEWIAQAHPSYIIISDMLTQCFNIPREKQRMKDSYRLAGILRNLGWSKSNHRINGELRKVWVNHE